MLRHGNIARATFVHLMCVSMLTLMHFRHDGSKGLMKTKFLILKERIFYHIAVTCRFAELSVCGWGREHEKM